MPAAIPPISFARFADDPQGFAAQLGASFERYGFAVIADHGLPQARIAAAQAAVKRFFTLPEAVKRRYVVGAAGQRGYTPFGVETAKGAAHHDLKEFWHVGRGPAAGDPTPRAPNLWPDEAEGFEAELTWLYEALDAMGRQVLEGVALHLDLPRSWFGDKVDRGDSILRLLHYPPVSGEGPHVRAAAHADINVITLLLGAEEAGLEVLTKEGDWLPINPAPGALVCNIGDMLDRLTNGVLPSTQHRVVNPPVERRGTARYSTPFFLHFNPDFRIETLPQCAHAGQGQPPITAGAFLQERLREIKLA